MSDARLLASQMSDAERMKMKRRLLEAHELHDGRILALCRSCPKKVHDYRRPGNRAFSSGYSSTEIADINDWWDAHVCTEMHEWYLTAPRESQPRQPKERELADQIFGKRDKRTGKAPKLPFKYARRFHD